MTESDCRVKGEHFTNLGNIGPFFQITICTCIDPGNWTIDA
jgi:hypothetical protein